LCPQACILKDYVHEIVAPRRRGNFRVPSIRLGSVTTVPSGVGRGWSPVAMHNLRTGNCYVQRAGGAPRRESLMFSGPSREDFTEQVGGGKET
jgi:hypothetical protein